VFFGPAEPWYLLWFVLKLLGVVVITEYVTCLFARLRIDQVLTTNWKVLLPLSVLSLTLTIAVATWIYPLVT
jgi:NADH-quinone oxidoreductase subunit H